MGNSFLIFWRTTILFSIVAAPIYNPTNSAQELSFDHIFVNICYLFSFYDSSSDRCEVVFLCGFCIFLMIADVEYLFMWLLTIYLSSLGKCLKETINKMKRQLTEWENLFENDILKGINIQITHTKNMQLNVKKTKNSIKKWAEDLNRNFSILKKDLLKYSFSFWTNIYLKIAVNPYSPFVWDWIKFYWILCIC